MQTSYLTTKAIGALSGELKTFNAISSGMLGLTGSIAVRRFYVDKENQPQTNLTFIDWEYWHHMEEQPLLKFKKGDYLKIEGELYEKNWETSTGEKRRKHYLKARSVSKCEA